MKLTLENRPRTVNLANCKASRLLEGKAMSNNTVGRPMEILLIEDSLTAACLTIGALKKGKLQHRLTWLTDGEEALEFLYRRRKFARAPRPDLILLDLSLPKKDG